MNNSTKLNIQKTFNQSKKIKSPPNRKSIHTSLENTKSLYALRFLDILKNNESSNLLIINSKCLFQLFEKNKLDKNNEKLNNFNFLCYDSDNSSVKNIAWNLSNKIIMKYLIENMQETICNNDNINNIYKKYYYKIFLNIIKGDKLSGLCIKKICGILNRDLFLKDEEISNCILNVMKILFEKYSNSVSEIFSSNLVSNSIMYKTWNSMKNRKIILDVFNTFILDDNKFKSIFKNETKTIMNELRIIESLCDHECIREEIRIKLKEVFTKNSVENAVEI